MNADSRARILVVDDVADTVDTMVAMLELEGFSPCGAYGGEEALDAVDHFRPECIIFDIGMPDIDGLELARRMRATYGDDVVLIAFTGEDPDDVRVKDVFRVVDHYFMKPVGIEALLKALRPRLEER